MMRRVRGLWQRQHEEINGYLLALCTLIEGMLVSLVGTMHSSPHRGALPATSRASVLRSRRGWPTERCVGRMPGLATLRAMLWSPTDVGRVYPGFDRTRGACHRRWVDVGQLRPNLAQNRPMSEPRNASTSERASMGRSPHPCCKAKQLPTARGGLTKAALYGDMRLTWNRRRSV